MPKKLQKVSFDVIIVYVLHFKHDDFTWKSVRFIDEALRFKLQTSRERKWQESKKLYTA